MKNEVFFSFLKILKKCNETYKLWYQDENDNFQIQTMSLGGYCTPDQFLYSLCIFLKNYNTLVASKICFLGTAHKLIGNALPISARVGKTKLAMNVVHIGKISCLCLLSTCLCAVFMILRASIQQNIPDLLPNRLCRLLQISAKHCRLVSVPPLIGNIPGNLITALEFH